MISTKINQTAQVSNFSFFSLNKFQQLSQSKISIKIALKMEGAKRFKDPVLERRYQALKEKYNLKSYEDKDGIWDTGDDGTFICMYTKNQWQNIPDLIQKMFDAYDIAMQTPFKIGQFMKGKQYSSQGMNYLSDGKQLGQALIQCGYGLTEHQKKSQAFNGSVTELQLKYFKTVLASLKGDVSQILTYLTKGMVDFQVIAKDTTVSKQASQMIILVTARVIGDKFRVGMTLKWNSSSQTTSQQVVKVACGSKTVQTVIANFESATYAYKGVKTIEQIQKLENFDIQKQE